MIWLRHWYVQSAWYMRWQHEVTGFQHPEWDMWPCVYIYTSILHLRDIIDHRKLVRLGKDRHCIVHNIDTTTHYSDVIMGAMASQITSLTIVCSTVYSGADQRKQQSSASLAFARGIHRWRGKCFHLMTSSWVPRLFNRHTCLSKKNNDSVLVLVLLCT